MAKGGYELMGGKFLPGYVELEAIASEIDAEGIDTIAITSVFSPVSDEMERKAMEAMAAKLPNANSPYLVKLAVLGYWSVKMLQL